MDISQTALKLARHNLELNVRQGNLDARALAEVNFRRGDVLGDASVAGPQDWDVVISNPPYISRTSFGKDTTRSARIFEPKLAMVPQCKEVGRHGNMDTTGDVFYPRIIDLAQRARAKVVVMEMADAAQAHRIIAQVSSSLLEKSVKKIELWHDNLYNVDLSIAGQIDDSVAFVPVGNGKARAVALILS